MTEQEAEKLGEIEGQAMLKGSRRKQRADESLCDSCSNPDGSIAPTHFIPTAIVNDGELSNAFCSGVIHAFERYKIDHPKTKKF